MVHYSQEDITKMQNLYRINLINSCSGFKSANLIGTASKNGEENVAVFSSVTHIGSNPPLLGFVLLNHLRNTGLLLTNRRELRSALRQHAGFALNSFLFFLFRLVRRPSYLVELLSSVFALSL